MNHDIAMELKNWIPYRLFNEKEEIFCRWLYLGDNKFNDPFFEETIARCKKLSENSTIKPLVSRLDVLPDWALSIDTVPPTAIIFHISRCGSTMISQLLGLSVENIVLSEVPFFDELLRKGFNNHSIDQDLPVIKAAIDFYGTNRTNGNKHLFIKTDSWHIHFYTYYRLLYPNIPFIFLYRRPEEVIRSQQKRRGMQAVPGVLEADIFGFDIEKIIHMNFDEYMAMVIESYLTAFIEIHKKDPLTIPVNYNEGMVNIAKKIADVSGISTTEDQLAEWQKRTEFHGKYPDELFTENPIEALSHPSYLQKCFELYNDLEQIRLTHQPTS